MRRMRGVPPRQKSSAISGSFAPLYAAKKKKKKKKPILRRENAEGKDGRGGGGGGGKIVGIVIRWRL